MKDAVDYRPMPGIINVIVAKTLTYLFNKLSDDMHSKIKYSKYVIKLARRLRDLLPGSNKFSEYIYHHNFKVDANFPTDPIPPDSNASDICIRFSGGTDSTLTAAICAQYFQKVYLLTFKGSRESNPEKTKRYS